MSTKVPQNNEDQEIDIFDISKGIQIFFDKINTLIFKSIHFFVRNWIIVLTIVILGFGFGLFLDNTQKSYDNQIIVQPNFGSVDYLYSKVDLIDAKITSGDTVFLKNVVGISHPKKIKKIEIKPVADVYNFIKNKPENFELIKLMADNSDIKKIIEDNLTSKNYTYHTISFVTDDVVKDKGMAEALLSFFNNTKYYKKIQEASVKNIEAKMIQNDTIISQINNVLGAFSAKEAHSQKSDKLVYYNENTQLNDVIKTKDELVIEQGIHRIELIACDKIIKDVSTTTNIEKTGFFYGKKKIVLPLIFIFMYVLISIFIAFYRKQSLILQKNN
nr:hypothetical protein [uncultured Flavobacterium sp.]